MIKRITTSELNNRILMKRMLDKGLDTNQIIAKLDQGLSISQIYKNARDNMAFAGI